MKDKKIRSYNKTDKCFYYFLNGGYFDKNGDVADRWKFNWDNAEDSTCLRDKNGKEIFEGDIWKRDGFIGVVEFKFSEWHIETTKSSNSIQYPSFYGNAHGGEIIGSIRETPELMEAI